MSNGLWAMGNGQRIVGNEQGQQEVGDVKEDKTMQAMENGQ